MKKILALLGCLLILSIAHAQDFTFGALNRDDYNFNRETLDSNANAIVLKEFGKTSMNLNDAGRIEIVFEYHVRIKIFNKDGYKQANIIIPAYKDANREETISDIQASTFNYEGFTFMESPMDKKVIFKENQSKYTVLTKFTLPNIKDGSIIEYSYRLISPNLFNFKSWQFQSDIPKVSSEYLVYIPAIYNYNVSLRGYQKLSEQKTELAKECMRISGINIDCSKITYAMKNIPAFIEEDYMTAASNYKSAIYFELSDVQRLNGATEKYTKTWKDVDNDLTSEKSLGSQMRRKDLFKDAMPSILKNSTDDLSKAKAVYEYIKKLIKWNQYYGKYSEENIKKAIDLRAGNAADINLSLIAALSAADLDAEAVILSTRDNGTVNKLYPVMSEFNYLIAKVNIDGKSYLLDATEPLLPFGLLPLRCINDQGRVINLKKPSYWIDLKADKKESIVYNLKGSLSTDGKIKATITTHSQGYAAFKKRKEIKKYNSTDEYVEKLDERMSKMRILNYEINSIDSVENVLSEKYEVEFTLSNDVSKDMFYFNPFLINPVSKNPFNLNERTYPVDLGAASDERIIIDINLPAGYTLIEQPKDLSIALPNSGGRYLLKTAFDNNSVMVSRILQFNKAIYEPEEYLFLKAFYSQIIQNQKSELLFKKQ